MRKILRTALLAAAAITCFALLALGILAALFLFPLGFIGLVAGISSINLRLMGVAFFGLVTVGLCSFACFTGLIYHFNACLDAIGHIRPAVSMPMLITTLMSVIATIGIYHTATDGWFLPACIFADVVHIVYIIVYVRDRQRRKTLCDNSSSSLPDSQLSSPSCGS